MDPRPDRRTISPFLLLALLPAAVGGLATAPGVPSVPAHTESTDSSVLWVFLAPGPSDGLEIPEGLEGLGARIRTRSRWLGAVSVTVPSDRITDLERLPGVEGVQPVNRLVPPGQEGFPPGGISGPPVPASVPALGPSADTAYGDLGAVLDRVGIRRAHALGFQGTGTRVGILDAYFLIEHPTLLPNPPVAVRDFVDDDQDVRPGALDPEEAGAHGTALWSLLGADLPGVLRGGSPGAGILLARVRSVDGLAAIDEDHWVEGLEWLESQGARVVLSGFGFRKVGDLEYSIEELNGDVVPATAAADQAARRGVLVVTPVGNEGPDPQTLQAPADGDSVLAVGSVQPEGGVSVFSAFGPTADGRGKPELLGPGERVPAAVLQEGDGVGLVNGTEFAAALLAGAAALFVEAYPERGPMEVVHAFTASAPAGPGGAPGVPNVASAILFPDGIEALPVQEVGGDGRVTSLAPQFQWNTPTLHPLGLPVSFHLEFSEDSLFQGIVFQDSVVGTFARRLRRPLPPRSRLFWRVEARSVQGIALTTEAQGPLEVPDWVYLDVLNDPGGTQLSDPTPEFLWSAVALPGPAGPFTYELQVLSDREEEVLHAYAGIQEESFQVPEALPFNIPLRWRVVAKARSGEADTVSSAGPFVIAGSDSPPVTLLHQNFPNPFPNRDLGELETRIWFDLAARSAVNLGVFDLRGRLVRRLIPGPGCGPVELPPGLYGRQEDDPGDPCIRFAWDGRDDLGREVAPGVYLLRFRGGGAEQIRRVVFWP